MSHNMAVIAGQLRAAGYRVTPQRQIILDTLCALGDHVTAEELYAAVQATLPSLNRATIYRTLHFLTEQHILSDVQLPDGRLGYEITGADAHHHLLCRNCGKSFVLPHNALCELSGAIEAQYGFAIDMDHISFLGHCAACRKQTG